MIKLLVLNLSQTWNLLWTGLVCGINITENICIGWVTIFQIICLLLTWKIHTHTHRHPHTQAQAHPCTHAFMHTHTHTHTHTCTWRMDGCGWSKIWMKNLPKTIPICHKRIDWLAVKDRIENELNLKTNIATFLAWCRRGTLKKSNFNQKTLAHRCLLFGQKT
jgi:hypothetical protein